jgi:V/A-type H+/Na+-transporting ATPase subunit D
VTGIRGLPPGRAGRTWLARRLETSRRGAELLERKQQILRREQARFAQRARDATSRWEQALEQAEGWALRAVLLAGDAALEQPAQGASSGVHLEWSAVMGTRFPQTAVLEPHRPQPPAALAVSSAVSCAALGYQRALEAAVEAATATAALRVIDEEITATTLRVRAIEQRWVPRLEAAASRLDLVLAETESAEAVRRRLALRGGRR